MSHTVFVATQVRQTAAIAAACRRLGLAEPTRGIAKQYAGQAEGVIIQFPGWRYPIVADTETGSIAYDHFGGRWGEPVYLDLFLQAYAVEVARIDARRLGRTVNEQQLPDGSVLLDIQVGE